MRYYPEILNIIFLFVTSLAILFYWEIVPIQLLQYLQGNYVSNEKPALEICNLQSAVWRKVYFQGRRRVEGGH